MLFVGSKRSLGAVNCGPKLPFLQVAAWVKVDLGLF